MPGLHAAMDATGQEAQLHRDLFAVMCDAAGLAAAICAGGGAGAAKAAADGLLRHLAQGALTVPRRFEAMRAFFVLGRALAPDDPLRPALAAALLEAALDAMPEPAGEDPLKLSRRNNHLLLQAAMLRAWPDLPGERDEVAAALVARFLGQMTGDGLFPSELCRGASCLWYANMAVMLLTAITAMDDRGSAPLVPRDSLARAVAGFGCALDLPPQVRQLARQNLYPHPKHGFDPARPDLGFLEGYHRSRHYLAWVPVAALLLPGHPMPVAPSPDDRFPLGNDFLGGFAEVVARDLQPL